MRSAHLALKGRPTGGDKGLKTPSSADNRLIDTTQTAREEAEIFIRKPEVRDPKYDKLSDVARAGRPGGGQGHADRPFLAGTDAAGTHARDHDVSARLMSGGGIAHRPPGVRARPSRTGLSQTTVLERRRGERHWREHAMVHRLVLPRGLFMA